AGRFVVMWARPFWHHESRTPTHGYAPITRGRYGSFRQDLAQAQRKSSPGLVKLADLVADGSAAPCQAPIEAAGQCCASFCALRHQRLQLCGTDSDLSDLGSARTQ